MKLTLCAFTFVALFCGSMTQVLPHYNGVVVMQDESAPFISKIINRLNVAFIRTEQRDKEAVAIVQQAQDNFRQCKVTYGDDARMLGSLKGCLGRFTGIAMSQISTLESFNRNNVLESFNRNIDSGFLVRNSNPRLNARKSHSTKQSNESQENRNKKNSNESY